MEALTKDEEKERLVLIDLKGNHIRPFSESEWNRLRTLNRKLYSGAGSPHRPF